jgi:hypothetical protein
VASKSSKVNKPSSVLFARSYPAATAVPWYPAARDHANPGQERGRDSNLRPSGYEPDPAVIEMAGIGRTVKRSDTDDFGCGSQSLDVQPWLRRKRPIGVEMGKLIHAAIASLDG